MFVCVKVMSFIFFSQVEYNKPAERHQIIMNSFGWYWAMMRILREAFERFIPLFASLFFLLDIKKLSVSFLYYWNDPVYFTASYIVGRWKELDGEDRSWHHWPGFRTTAEGPRLCYRAWTRFLWIFQVRMEQRCLDWICFEPEGSELSILFYLLFWVFHSSFIQCYALGSSYLVGKVLSIGRLYRILCLYRIPYYFLSGGYCFFPLVALDKEHSHFFYCLDSLWDILGKVRFVMLWWKTCSCLFSFNI